MLFLLNDEVLDIGDPENTLVDTLGVIGVRHERLSARDVIEMAQQIYFRTGRGRDPTRNVRLAIASLCALKLEADAAMFIVPPDARTPDDVKFNSREAPLTMLAQMFAIQSAGGITPPLMKQTIWRSAA
ncbi:MAG: hypothetical protein ABI740_05895 [Alphaproteobacteria bacterium]